MQNITFTAISFIFFTAMVGFISSKLVTSDDQNTKSGYFLAGRGLSGIFIAGSMMLTNISAENLVGLSGQSYGANMSGMAWESTAVIATIVMATIFLPVYLRKGYTTLPEFLEDRFDKGVRRYISFLFLLGYVLFAIPVCLYAGAIGFNQIFNLSAIFGVSQATSMTIVIVALGIIGAMYAVFGGLKAVAVSDTINGVLLVAGGMIIPVFGLIALGKVNGGSFAEGLNQVLTVNPEKLNAIGSATDPVPFSAIFTGMIFANLFYWGTNQVLIQRTLGAKNLKEGQKGVLLSGFLKVLIPIILVFPGVIAYHLIPGLEKSDFAYPQLVAKVLPWPLVGLFCAGLFGAIVSTYNSLLNSAATIFMLDIYKPIINPKIEDNLIVKKAKQFSLFIAIFSICIAPLLQNVGGIYNFGRATTGFYNMPIITVVLFGMFTKKASPLGAKIAITFHLFFYGIMKYVVKVDTDASLIGIKISFIHVFAISVLIMAVIIAITSFIKPSTKEFDKNSVKNKEFDMTPWVFTKPISITLVSFLVYIYLMLSPLGLATQTKNLAFIIPVSILMVFIAVFFIGGTALKSKQIENKNLKG